MDFASLPFTLRQLQYAVAVADLLSFRRAAEQCHVSQPSLSAQVALMEAALGVRLFERDRRRVLVTSAGVPLLERARRILRESDDLTDAARRADDPLGVTLRLGVIPTIAEYLLPRIVATLHRRYPRLTIQWQEEKTAGLVSALHAGDLDAVLLALEADLGEVEREVIARDPFVLAAAPGHRLARARRPVRLPELSDADVLVLDEGHCFGEQALAYCSRSDVSVNEFRATSITTLVQMVAVGAGVTLLPALAVPTETRRARIAVRPFATPGPSRTIGLVWRKQTPVAEALRAVAATARRAYQRSPRRAATRPV